MVKVYDTDLCKGCDAEICPSDCGYMESEDKYGNSLDALTPEQVMFLTKENLRKRLRASIFKERGDLCSRRRRDPYNKGQMDGLWKAWEIIDETLGEVTL